MWQICEILKELRTIAGEKFFLQKINLSNFDELNQPTNSNFYYAIALKFLAEQINLVAKKSASAICEIITINADFKVLLMFGEVGTPESSFWD